MTDTRELVDELRLIGCHASGDARCNCGIGQDAADTITALAEENRMLRTALTKINVGDGWAAQIARAALAQKGGE